MKKLLLATALVALAAPVFAQTAFTVNGQRTKLGIPYLQLGCNGKGRISLVDEKIPENGRIFRCLPN